MTQMQPMSVIFTVPEDDFPDEILREYQARATNSLAYGLRSRQSSSNCCRKGGDARQPDRHDDRHDQIARAVRQCRRDAVPQPVRQYPLDRLYDQERARRAAPAIQHGAPGDYVYVVKDGKASVQRSSSGKTDGPYVQSCTASRRAIRWWSTAPIGCATAPRSASSPKTREASRRRTRRRRASRRRAINRKAERAVMRRLHKARGAHRRQGAPE